MGSPSDGQEGFCVRALVTDSHHTGEHARETHGHKTVSESGEKREEEEKAEAKGTALVYERWLNSWCLH